MPIRKIKARMIFDSRGEPTVEVDLVTEIGLLRSSVPSTVFPNPNGGKEIRDGNASAYNGRSVFKVIDTINNIIALEIMKAKLDVNQQREIDLLMQNLDGTPDKSKLGVNAIFGVSVACCKAAAAKRGLPLYRYIATLCDNDDIYLPVPVFNVMSGGRAAGNNLVYQEFLILPTGAANFAEAMKMGTDVYREFECQVAELQEEAKLPLPVVNEGCFAPELEDDKEGLSTIEEAIKAAGHDGKIKIALDIGASTFCKEEGMYDLEYKTDESDPENYLTQEAMREQYEELFSDCPTLVSLEDPFDKEDWDGWSELMNQMPQVQIVADELTATNPARLEEAIEKNAANCLIIRPSQIGTITEAIDCIKMARDSGWSIIVSAGQVETEDTFIADFAVGTSAGQFKAGAPCRTERIVKYNQILRIEEELGKQAKYAGERYRNPLEK